MKKRIAAIAVILAVLACAGCGNTAATVNGEKISRDRLDKMVNLYVINYEEAYQLKIDPKESKQLMSLITDMALDDLIEETIHMQEVKKRGFKVTDEEFSKALTQTKLTLGGDKAYAEYIKKAGMSSEEFEKELKNQMLIQKLELAVTKDIKVTSEEVKSYYDQHPEEFGNPQSLKVSHILVKTKEEAEKVIKRVKAGEDFGKLAEELSIEPAAKVTKGDLGFINETSSLIPEFKAAALALKPGQYTTEPVKTEVGYHVIKAFEEKAAHKEAFKDVETDAMMKAEAEKKDKAWSDYTEKLKKQAKIKKNIKTDTSP